MRLEVEKIGKSWWITGDIAAGAIGPYYTNSEAIEACRGLRKFYRHKNEPGFICGDEYIKDEII